MKRITHPSVTIREIDTCTFPPLNIDKVNELVAQAIGSGSHQHVVSEATSDASLIYHYSNSKWETFAPPAPEPAPDSTMSFHNTEGHVGTITWDTGTVKFEGDFDDCATILFHRVNDLLDYQIMKLTRDHQEELRASEANCLIKVGNLQNILDLT